MKLTYFLIYLLLILLSCNDRTKADNFVVTKFIKAKGLHYGKPSKIDRVEYLKKEEIIYRNGSLVEYILFRSEGGVSYTREELETDTLLKSELNIPLKRKIEVAEKFLIDGKNHLTIDHISSDSIIQKNNNILYLYRILK